MSIASRVAPTARNVGVASASLLLIGGAATYALAPAGDALAARIATIASAHGKTSISGRIEQHGHPTGGETVKIEKTVNGRTVVLKTIDVSKNGRFADSVTPGRYTVVIAKGGKHITEPIAVTPGHSKYLGVTITHHAGGFGITPVIFNY